MRGPMHVMALAVGVGIGIGIGIGVMLGPERVQAQQAGLTRGEASIRSLTISAPRGHSRIASPYMKQTNEEGVA
jgi:hypothetical protein